MEKVLFKKVMINKNLNLNYYTNDAVAVSNTKETILLTNAKNEYKIISRLHENAINENTIENILDIIDALYEECKAYKKLMENMLDILNRLSWNRIMKKELNDLVDNINEFLEVSDLLPQKTWQLKLLRTVLKEWDCELDYVEQISFIKSLISDVTDIVFKYADGNNDKGEQ